MKIQKAAKIVLKSYNESSDTFETAWNSDALIREVQDLSSCTYTKAVIALRKSDEYVNNKNINNYKYRLKLEMRVIKNDLQYYGTPIDFSKGYLKEFERQKGLQEKR